MLLTMILKINLWGGEMGEMVYDSYGSLKKSFAGGYKFNEFALLYFCCGKRHWIFSHRFPFILQ